MNGTECADEELVRRIVGGEQYLFHQIVDRYRDKVAGLIFSVTNSRDELEDIAQEVFISAYKNLNAFENRSRFSTWIYRITINKCRDWQRRTYSRRALEYLGFGGADRASPYENDGVEDREEIRTAVRNLPDKYKVVIILYYYHDLSCQEVADVLGIPKKTVETRLIRGRNQLGASIKRGGEAEWSAMKTLKML